MGKGLRLLANTSILAACLWSSLTSRTLAFTDIQDHWANQCISQMAPRKLVSGYPDGSFRPQATITRAEFAVLMLNAFPNAPQKRNGAVFYDVPSHHWARRAIQDAYQRGFFSGYPNNLFKPNQPIPRVQAIGVLAGAKNYSIPNNPSRTLWQYFQDAGQIPDYAKNAIAASAVNSLVVNHPNPQQLEPNRPASRGEVAALLCRALNIYAVPPEYIAGVEARYQEIRPLPGQLDTVPMFNSNSPELVRTEGILLSTLTRENKRVPSAHLGYAFQGRFDIFTHHIARADTQAQTHPLYQGLILHNEGDTPITVEVLHAASYLSTPEAPFVSLPDIKDNPNGKVYSGPGSRMTSDILRGVRQEKFPEQLVIPPRESRILMNQPISVRRAPASNGRSTLLRLRSSGRVYVANLAMKAPRQRNGSYRAPTLEEWQTFLVTAGLAGPRDHTPTPLDPPREPTIFGRVAGVSKGSQWEGSLTDNPNVEHLSIPEPGKAFSYVLGTLHRVTLGTGQIQSAPMIYRYPDTAYYAHSNYGVEYNLTLPLKNETAEPQTVTVMLETPLKDEAGTHRLLFLKPRVEQVFFRGTVKVSYEDDEGETRTRYVHLVQRRGQPGDPLVKLELLPGEQRQVQVDLIYPPDSTPPQVLTVKTTE
jgi:hypothetical protein